MNVFLRNQYRPLARASLAVLACGLVTVVAGCASGQRQTFFGNRAMPPFGGQPVSPPTSPDPLPTPVIPPETSPQAPGDSGPVILPRDSVAKPRPNDFAQQQRSRSPARLLAPIIEPRTTTPRSLPSIRYSDPPAALSGNIEIVPNSPHIGPLSQEKHFDIVPADPPTEETGESEEQSLFSNKGYVELPPPPE